MPICCSTLGRRLSRNLGSVFVLLLLAACGGSGDGTATPETTGDRATSDSLAIQVIPQASALETAETDRQVLRRTSERLAGLEVPEGPRQELWATHRQAMDSLWATIEERHLDPMGGWASTALASVQQHPEAVFYPFGGPDFPSVEQFFPTSSTYVLVGLEPPGTLPDLAAFSDEVLSSELERLRDGLSNLADKGYFVARHMVLDFGQAQRLEGFVPVLYIFLARAGFEPTSVRFLDLSDSGELRYLEGLTDTQPYAVEMLFVPRDAPQAAPRRLYYFSQDLSDQGLAAKPGFEAFVRRLGAFDVYMKSAMYLPHEPEFGRLEALMLDGRSVLQDDSGVPWHRFDAERWQVDLFGVYTKTLANYRQYFQADMAAAYAQREEPSPLPFAIGYNSRISGSCLLWARRKDML